MSSIPPVGADEGEKRPGFGDGVANAEAADLDPFGTPEEHLMPDTAFEDLKPKKTESRFKVFDPQDPVGSKPKYSEDQVGAILWTKEKKEYEDSQRVVLSGARVG